MGGEMVMELWFDSLRRISRKSVSETNKAVIGILAYEVASLMSKVIIENFGSVARSVARLGKRCTDPVYHRFENFIEDPVLNNFEWFGWEYREKKMERKLKKMKRFVAATLQLSQELEVLAELEQTLRRMQVNAEFDRVKLLEFRQKVTWQRQEVKIYVKCLHWLELMIILSGS
ncbi:hypothetical protein LWI29_033536 [Acer saccharum]|uniref:Uncharacterized protein n=1 Tax=Acer saccharum TaxID=4024 RepID=A0AA39RYA8_ACESA|nr:hypothetical protein LWI29_033536 [Acer saccharum]